MLVELSKEELDILVRGLGAYEKEYNEGDYTEYWDKVLSLADRMESYLKQQ